MKLEILLVEDYAHPIGKVWAALTDPAALAEWLMVNDFEPQVGKRFTLRGERSASGADGWTARCWKWSRRGGWSGRGRVRSRATQLAWNSGLSQSRAARG